MLDDPIANYQIAQIDSLARVVFGDDYTGESFLSARIAPIYGRGLYELTEGQARMVLDDLRYAAGESGAFAPDWASIVPGPE